jgi:small subunit ribosomal protein S1
MSKERIKSTQFQTFDPNIIEAGEYAALVSAADVNLKALYDQQTGSYAVNSIVKGKIIEKTDDGFRIDIAYKSNGFVPFEEFNSIELQELKINSSIEVMIEELENSEGGITLSYERAKATRSWERIALLYKENKPVEGVVVNKVQGGLCVDIGITVFLPGSQIDTQRVVDFDSWIGKKIQAYIIKLMPKRGNVVISRRKFIYEQKSEARKGIIDTFQEGQVVQGVVKNITKYGAFVDIGGVDGLLHITDMTWSRIEDQTELMSIGDSVTVKILSFDKENEKISLGMKQLTDNPWDNLEESLQANSIVKGKIISIKDYGIFIEVIKGVEGLVHISEISWTDRITDLNKHFKIGQEVDATIVALERKNRRMSLSIKQLEKNPWDRVFDEYKVGQKVKGKVTNIADFGFFVQIAPGIDGLVYVSDISWTQHIKHPSDLYSKGQEIEAIIIDINHAKKKIALSIKALHENPWKSIEEKISVGAMVAGVVSKITEFGAFIKLKNIDVEAFIHSSECSDSYNVQINSVLVVDKEYTFKVIRVSAEEQKIGLSLKKEERNNDKKYDKKTYYKENREGKSKDENSRNKDKKDFNKKDQNKTYTTTSTDSKKKSSLQLEVERLMEQNKQKDK